jgi:alpha-tubulin suppressor-like RCC1 family protein
MLYWYIISNNQVEAKTFSWGYSENGRLGSVDKNECDQKKKMLTPREIIILKGNKISQVYAGHHHSFAVSLTGKVWGWGENVNRIMGELKSDVDKKKGSKNVILYYPEELLINKNLVVSILYKVRESQEEL